MAIRRVTSDTQLNPGQFILFESMQSDGICSRPCVLTSSSGQRVYFDNQHGEPEGYRQRKSVVFVCDTLAEATMLRQINDAQLDQILKATTLVKNQYQDQINALIAKG